MAGTAAAVGTAKGFRGVAQDFLAPELRALTERLQGFENLNRERFSNVDRQIADLKEDIRELRAEVKDLRGEIKAINARIDALPREIATSIDRLITALDVSNRLAAIERGKPAQTPA